MSLLQYFLQKGDQIANDNANFSEWQLFFAYQIFSYSFFFPFFKRLNFHRLYSYVVASALFVTPLIFFNFLGSIYVDAFLGIAAAACTALLVLSLRHNEEHYDLLILSTVSVLVLTKDAGAYFAVFLCLFFVLSKSQPGNIRSILSSSAKALAAFLLPKALWEYDVFISGAEKKFSGSYSIRSIINILTGHEKSYRIQVLKNFYNSLTKPSEASFLGNHLPYPFLFAVIACLLCISLIFLIRKDQKNYRKYQIFFFLSLPECMLYIIGLCLSYMYKFDEGEAIALSSFDRYLSITFEFLLILSCLCLIPVIVENKISRSIFASFFFCFILSFAPFDTIRENLSHASAHMYSHYREPYDNFAAEISKHTDKDSSVMILSQTSSTQATNDHYIFRYDFLPQNDGKPVISVDSTCILTDQSQMNSEQLLEFMKTDCDILAIYKCDDFFKHSYSSAFDNPKDISDCQIFKLNNSTGKLEKIN